MNNKITMILAILVVFLALPMGSNAVKYSFVPCTISELSACSPADFVCVKSGDWLSKIYEENEVEKTTQWDFREFVEKNKIDWENRNIVYVGQKICISEEGCSELEKLFEKNPSDVDYITYNVKEGESLFSIWMKLDLFSKYGLPFSLFMKKNMDEGKLLDANNQNYLKTGQEIIIPKQAESTPPPEKTKLTFVFDESGILSSTASESIKKSLSDFYEKHKTLIVLEVVKEVKNKEEATQIMSDRFNGLKNPSNAVDFKKENLVVLYSEKYPDKQFGLFVYGYDEKSGGTTVDVYNIIKSMEKIIGKVTDSGSTLELIMGHITGELDKQLEKPDNQCEMENPEETVFQPVAGKETYMVITTSEVISSLGNTYGKYIKSLKSDSYNPVEIIMDDPSSIVKCDSSFTTAMKPPIQPKFSKKVIRTCVQKFNPKVAVILGGHGDIEQFKHKTQGALGNLYEDYIFYTDSPSPGSDFNKLDIAIGRVPRSMGKEDSTIKDYLENVAIPLHNSRGISKSYFEKRYAWIMKGDTIKEIVKIYKNDKAWIKSSQEAGDEWLKKAREEPEKFVEETNMGWASDEYIVYEHFGGDKTNKLCYENPNCDLSPPILHMSCNYPEYCNDIVMKNTKSNIPSNIGVYFFAFHGDGTGFQSFSDEYLSPNYAYIFSDTIDEKLYNMDNSQQQKYSGPYGTELKNELDSNILNNLDIWKNSIFITTACWGGRIHNIDTQKDSIVLSFLSKGGIAYIGHTTMNLGTNIKYDHLKNFLKKDIPGLFKEFQEDDPIENSVFENLEKIISGNPHNKIGNIIVIDNNIYLSQALYGDPGIRIRS